MASLERHPGSRRGLYTLIPVFLSIPAAVAIGVGGYVAYTVAALCAAILILIVANARGYSLVMPMMGIAWAACVFTSESTLQPDTYADPAGTLSAYKAVPIIFLVVVTAWIMLGQSRSGDPLPTAARWTVAYVGWLSLAALFSADHTFALLRTAQAAIPVVAALALRRRGGSGMWLLAGTAAACAVHVSWAVSHPRYVGVVGAQRLTGLLIANAFGLACAVVVVIGAALLVSTARRLVRWPVGLALIALGTYGIHEGIGRTAAIAAATAVVAIIVAGQDHRAGQANARRIVPRGLVVATVLVLAAFLAVSARAGLEAWFQTGDANLGTLSERTLIWNLLIPAALSRPVFGFGPGAIRSGGEVAHVIPGADIGQAHNAFVEALVSGGLPASFLWLGMIIALVVQSFRIRGPDRPFAIGVGAMIPVFAITIGNLAGFGMAWFLLASLLAFRKEPIAPASLDFPRAHRALGPAVLSSSPGAAQLRG